MDTNRKRLIIHYDTPGIQFTRRESRHRRGEAPIPGALQAIGAAWGIGQAAEVCGDPRGRQHRAGRGGRQAIAASPQAVAGDAIPTPAATATPRSEPNRWFALLNNSGRATIEGVGSANTASPRAARRTLMLRPCCPCSHRHAAPGMRMPWPACLSLHRARTGRLQWLE